MTEFTSTTFKKDGQNEWLQNIDNDPNRHHKVLDRYQEIIKLLLKPTDTTMINETYQNNDKISITNKAYTVDHMSIAAQEKTPHNMQTQTRIAMKSISTQTDPTVEVDIALVDSSTVLQSCRTFFKQSLLDSPNATDKKESIKNILLTMHTCIQDALQAVSQSIHDLEAKYQE